MTSQPAERKAETDLRRLSLVVAIVHLACAAMLLVARPGLSWEPDRVANRLYLAGLRSGAPRLAEQWYFPAPKILGVAIAAFGPLGEGVASAAAASVLAGAGCWLVGRAGGRAAAAIFAVALVLDPWWRVLVATASGDLFVAAGVAGAIAAWEGGVIAVACLAVLLSTLVKSPAGLSILPLVADAKRSRAARAGLIFAVGSASIGTWVGFRLLLGDASVPTRFLRAYAQLRGGNVPGVAPWLASWFFLDLLRDTLGWGSPLLVAGVASISGGERAGGMRRWLAGSGAVALGFVALAFATGSLLFPRFLWTLEVAVLGLAAVGAGWVGDRCVRWLGEDPGRERAGRLATVAAGGLLLSAIGLRPGDGASRFEVLYEHGARTAVPWLSGLAEGLPPGAHLVVPLWFQPAAMAILPEARVEAAEVLAATGAEGSPAEARWLLLAPAFGEPAGTAWLAEASQGAVVIEASELPHMALVRTGTPVSR